MIDYIIFVLWFFAPAGFANAAPIFANKIPLLNQWDTPIDFGKTYKGKRLLGNNKTWRGFCFGVFIALVTIILQKILYSDSSWLQEVILIDYSSLNPILGFLLGAGALIGDAVESFFKRQKDIPSGEAWFPFDQIDYIIGGILLSLLVVRLNPVIYLAILGIWFGLHIISSYIGFLLGLKDKPL